MPLAHVFVDRQAVAKGLGAFIALVICLPIIVVIIASIGPLSWMENYVDPAFDFKAALPILAGAFTAWSSNRSPLASALVVGAVGGALVALMAFLSGGWPAQVNAIQYVSTHLFITTGWCFVGGFCVALIRRGKNGL